MVELVRADAGPVLDAIIDASFDLWHDGLSRQAYGRYYQAQQKTPWARDRLRRVALVDGSTVLASAKIYCIDATLDGAAIRVAGLGAVFTQPAARRRGAARELIERILDSEAASGADLALLFSEIGPDYYARLGFEAVERTRSELRIAQSERHGAPMTMVRAGEERDLNDIALMERTRAEAFRFHLNRDRDLIHFSTARKRLRAGLGPAGVREVQFFIAEEGASAVAYVLLSVEGAEWSVEAAGDRDPSGARLGAILQVLIARDPAERRPAVSGWLPIGLLPPQISVSDSRPAPEIMMLKPLSAAAHAAHGLREPDILYWPADMF